MFGGDYPSEAVPRHVGVDLGGGDVRVAKKLLHRAQIGAALQEVGGEGVAQNVRAHALAVNSGKLCGFFQELREAAGRQLATGAAGREKPGTFLRASGEELGVGLRAGPFFFERSAAAADG